MYQSMKFSQMYEPTTKSVTCCKGRRDGLNSEGSPAARYGGEVGTKQHKELRIAQFSRHPRMRRSLPLQIVAIDPNRDSYILPTMKKICGRNRFLTEWCYILEYKDESVFNAPGWRTGDAKLSRYSTSIEGKTVPSGLVLPWRERPTGELAHTFLATCVEGKYKIPVSRRCGQSARFWECLWRSGSRKKRRDTKVKAELPDQSRARRSALNTQIVNRTAPLAFTTKGTVIPIAAVPF